MPRRAKGPRLWEYRRKGRDPVWIIRDDENFQRSTGTSCRREAESQLAAYIATKIRPSGPTEPDKITIGQILTIYAEEYAHTVADPVRISYAIDALEPFWGQLKASSIKGQTCRRYSKSRDVAPATVRRELGTLQSAINYCYREGYLLSAPVVTLPKKPEVRERFLTRQQVALLLLAARRLNVDGAKQMQRFIITSIYTGTRKTATLALGLDTPSPQAGWIDTRRGLIFRKGSAERTTAKRRRPAKCPRKLLSHAKRWKGSGSNFACEDYKGRRVANIRKGWDRMCEMVAELAEENGIEMPERKDLTPHILKHTAITWSIQNGASIEDAASFFSTSIATIEQVYWHHSPYFQEGAVEAIDNPNKMGI